ncbi:MAG: branched-chain amino acid aminotransferase [Bacteroidetes bacterium]|nr:branched-chain amino acid aminotransferase [Bacteroidota bacterium]
MEYTISITEQTERKITDTKSIPFGKVPTEHMFIAEYRNNKWSNPRIVPFSHLVLSPFALCLHYGQTVFEGMKAFMMQDGRINIYRPDKHYERFTKSLDRMCMPAVPKDLFTEALHQLVQLDSNWVPEEADGALYIRPFMIASEDRIGVKVSDEYLFMIVCSPAYQYYAKPLKVKIENRFVRAADGGTGAAKCGGNYGAAFYPTQQAREAGYDQVLWTDSRHHEFIEESGTMNVMFYIDNVLITPPLSGTILDGVTRDSLLTLAREKGIQIQERPISYTEIQMALEDGKRVEAFGAGTAAVIAPIETIGVGNKHYNCYIGEDALMYRLQEELYNIRKGITEDKHNWNYII